MFAEGQNVTLDIVYRLSKGLASYLLAMIESATVGIPAGVNRLAETVSGSVRRQVKPNKCWTGSKACRVRVSPSEGCNLRGG